MKDEVEEDEPGTATAGTSPEVTMPYCNARASRNLAEKQRRDNLNTNIAMMAAMVPIVAGSSRRQDKISILRLAGAYVRTDYAIGQGTPGFLPVQFNDIDLEQIFLDTYDRSGAFLLVVTTTGNIVHISKSVESSLGHAPSELLGKSLYSYIHPEDHDDLTRNLTPQETQLAITSSSDQNSNSSDGNINETNFRNFPEQRRNFVLKIAQRCNSRGEHTQYKCFEISGVLRLSDFCRNRRANREHTSTSNDIIFVGVARLMQRRLTELSLFEATKQEYVTRHLVDGRIIFCDHRISVVAGYMTEEVSGANAFRYMHKDDVRWTMIGLRQMYDRRDGFGSSCYRLLSKTGEFIYLRTHGYLEFDTKTGTFESFVCVNTLVDAKEGEKLIREMKDRYSATITNSSRSIIEPELMTMQSSSEPRVEDATQLEAVIRKLIKNVSSSELTEERSSISPAPDIQFAKAAMYSQKLPPVSVQASKLGVTPIEFPGKGKGKQLKKEIALVASPASSIDDGNCDEIQRHQVQACPSPDRRKTSNYRIPDKVISEIDNPVHSGEASNKQIKVTKPLCIAPQTSARCKEIYEAEVGRNFLITDKDNGPAVEEEAEYSQSNLSLNHRGKPDSMAMFIKKEAIEEIPEKASSKRSRNEDGPVVPDKRQRHGMFYSNGERLEESSPQDITNSDIIKILNDYGSIIDTDKDVTIADSFHPEQRVHEGLRQTHALLADNINYQEAQIDDLGQIIDHSQCPEQRNEIVKIQAEHEIQKKLFQTLQHDHHNMKVNIKQNIGV